MDSCRFYIYRTYHLQIQTVLVLLSDIEDFNFFFLTELLRNSLVAQLVKNPPAMQETLVGFRVRKIHWRRDRLSTLIFLGFSRGSDGRESTCNVGDLGSIPRLRTAPREGNGCPLQCSGLENSMDRGAWQATSPWGCKESNTTERQSVHSRTHTHHSIRTF